MKSTSFPMLSTERLLLRQIQQDDIQNIFHGLSNRNVIQYYGISFTSLEATTAQMGWFKNLEETETGIWWAICSKDNQTFYGAGGFNAWSKEHKKSGDWLLAVA